MGSKIKILVITPVKHIDGVYEGLSDIGEVSYHPDISEEQLIEIIHNYNVLFTNPNKSKVYIGKTVITAAKQLNVVCTASTGTVHIDKDILNLNAIKLISLTSEYETINKISSTAEHTLALMLASLRNVVASHNNAIQGEWNYEPYIGRQMDHLTVGVVGYGRLGKKFARYVLALGAKVIVYDPYVEINHEPSLSIVEDLKLLFQRCDIVSLHCHVSKDTHGMINEEALNYARPNLLLVNTARGELVDESVLVQFLMNNPQAKYATDVINNEQRARLESPLFSLPKNNQLIITQHIGGMTQEAQKIAYNRAVELLYIFLTSNYS